MTPDEALQAMRAALAVLMPRRASLIAAIGEDYKKDELDELIDAAAALDVWLSKGGWLPAAWSKWTPPTLQRKLEDLSAGAGGGIDPFPSARGGPQ